MTTPMFCQKIFFSALVSKLNMGFNMVYFFAGEVWCVADVWSVSPSLEQTLETSATQLKQLEK